MVKVSFFKTDRVNPDDRINDSEIGKGLIIPAKAVFNFLLGLLEWDRIIVKYFMFLISIGVLSQITLIILFPAKEASLFPILDQIGNWSFIVYISVFSSLYRASGGLLKAIEGCLGSIIKLRNLSKKEKIQDDKH